MTIQPVHQLHHGEHVISYAVQFSQRKTVSISVHSDTSVLVRAPCNMPRRDIETLLRKRAQWIVSKQGYFSTLPLRQPKRYTAGESHYFLGQAYPLHIVPQRGGGVTLEAGQLRVHTVDTTSTVVKDKLNTWYRQQAKIVFAQRLDMCYQRARAVLRLTHLPTLQIRRMKRRWGSCSRQGNIMLNTHLVKTPVMCIDYVIVHELCHLREFNHSRAFYTLMQRILPDWERRKKQLESLDVLDS